MEEIRFVYRLEKIIQEGDTPSMLMITLSEEHNIDDIITLQNSTVEWKVLTKENIPSSENVPRFDQ